MPSLSSSTSGIAGIPLKLALQRRGRVVWLVLCVPIVLTVLLLDLSGSVSRLNHVLLDSFIRLQTRDVSDSPVLIVAIDDKSIASLGQWPWTRGLHASLIDRISSGQPKAIGLDMLLIEPSDNPAADKALADSLRRSGKVALPILMQDINDQATAVYPIPPFANAAAALGHVHLDIDSDGVARTIHLREGFKDRQWPHLSLAMLQIARDPAVNSRLAQTFGQQTWDASMPQLGNWLRMERTVIPFAGPSHSFTYVSYIDVLQGRVDPAIFRDRYVLIGSSAAGVGDLYATPVSGRPRLMPGVEVTANMLDGLISGRSITPLPPIVNSAANAILTVAALALLLLLGPVSAITITLLLLAFMPLLSAVALMGFRIQLAPAAGMIGIILAYVLWSGWRLNTATRYLIDEFRALRDGTGIGQWASSQMPKPKGDFLERRIQALDQATRHLHDLYRLLSDSLESLPDATIACDLKGHVLLANQRAARLLGKEPDELVHANLQDLMSRIRQGTDKQPVFSFDKLVNKPTPPPTEARDEQGRYLLVKFASSHDASGIHTGWLLSLVDISDLKRAQKQRNESIRFLSHDIRAPQSAILALLDLNRKSPSHIPQDQFEARIERHARRTLKLSDDFIHLLRAQSHEYNQQLHNLADILDECMDDAWEMASRNHIRVKTNDQSANPAYALIDREMMARALGNLIGNAIKFSPPRSVVECQIAQATLTPPHAAWEVTIKDQGPGVEPELQAGLFTPFSRGSQDNRTDGAGLGLAFVKTVAERHGGKAFLRSTPGQGATFGIILPATQPDDID